MLTRSKILTGYLNRVNSGFSPKNLFWSHTTGEFILRRSKEVGSENWGKAISCDPPQFFPDVKFYWARDYFPNFVEEDRRVMVSYDGYIYFSALEKIDRGNYSCSVQSSVGNNGRNGPFFELQAGLPDG